MLSNLLVSLASWITIFGGLITIVIQIAPVPDKSIPARKEKAESISQIIDDLGFKVADAANIAHNAFFGDKIISWQAFYKSAKLSLLVVFALFAFFSVMNFKFTGKTSTPFDTADPFREFFVAFVFLIMNIFSDYISVSQTRIFVRLVKNKGFVAIFFVLLLDYFFSVLISPYGIFINFCTISDLCSTGVSIQSINLLLILPFAAFVIAADSATNFSTYVIQESVDYGFFLAISIMVSSVVTSLWIWMYVIGNVVLRIALLSSNFTRFFYKFGEKNEWYLVSPVVLGLAIICMLGIPVIIWTFLSTAAK